MKLELRTSITYFQNLAQGLQTHSFPCDGLAFAEKIKENKEVLFCFEINPKESRNFEPNREQLLGNLVFTGQKVIENSSHRGTEGQKELKDAMLPAGQYLFVQHRGETALDREEWLDMAIEQQKDGLWERNKPGNLLYVRYLYEDGAIVTQLFRTLD